MDPSKNKIPENVKTIHMTAVCGTAMGALACMLKSKGFKVTGSDQKVYPPMSDFLRGQGIEIIEGFDPANLSYGPDLVVIGNAISRDNPEAQAVLKGGLFYCSMPQALNHFFSKGKKTLVASGTHGKTTTSSLMAWVLYSAGLDPTFMIGGILQNFNSNHRVGDGDYIIFEGDEYDTAFFDKEAKFFHFDPDVTVLTSIEFDHADIFTGIDHIKRVFEKFLKNHKDSSCVIAYDADGNIDEVLSGQTLTIQRYGTGNGADWRFGNVRITPPWNEFEVYRHGEKYGDFKTLIPGEHNLLNILSVIATADRLGISSRHIAEALETFKGIKRRQEIRGVVNGITVMDDFAHHPTAVRETIKAVKPYYPDGRTIAVFEPRTNTSMRDVFQKSYPEAFDSADLICIRKPPLLEKIPENERFSSERLVTDMKQRGLSAFYFPDTDAIVEFLKEEAVTGDLILIMSNGGFDNIHEKVLSVLSD